MLYLGQPYSHEKSVIREVRYLAGCRACSILWTELRPVYSPIVHWHNVAMLFKLPKDATAWRMQNRELLYNSSEFAILMLDGWQQSVGLQEEFWWAKDFDKGIYTYSLSDSGLISKGRITEWPSNP